MALSRTLIDPKLIYLEPAVREYVRGQEVLARFPDAELVEVASHWKIAQLADPALAEDWLKVKRDTLVLGVKKGMAMRPNERSTDFIAPSASNGWSDIGSTFGRWEQAFSFDGASWEVNWIMQFHRQRAHA